MLLLLVGSYLVTGPKKSMLLLLVGSIFVVLPLTLTARSAARLIGGVPKYASILGYMRDTLHWLSIWQRIFYRVAVLVWHRLIGFVPVYFAGTLSPCVDPAWLGVKLFVPLLVANS